MRRAQSSRMVNLFSVVSRNARYHFRSDPGRLAYILVNRLKDGVRHRKAKKEDVDAVLWLHVDVDDTSKEALERIRNFVPPPTQIIFTGGGYQAFWCFEDPIKDLESVEALNAAIAKALRGDNFHNVDHLMRISSTINVLNAKKRNAGRLPALVHTVVADWDRTYSLHDFSSLERPQKAGCRRAQIPAPRDVVVIDLKDLSQPTSEHLQRLIEVGDDPDRPRGSTSPRHRTRSESGFAAACGLARAGCLAEAIAGVLLNPSHGISESVREKKDAAKYAMRQAISAISAVQTGYDPGEAGPMPLGYTKEGKFALLDRQMQVVNILSSNQLLSPQVLVGLAPSRFWQQARSPLRRALPALL